MKYSSVPENQQINPAPPKEEVLHSFLNKSLVSDLSPTASYIDIS